MSKCLNSGEKNKCLKMRKDIENVHASSAW